MVIPKYINLRLFLGNFKKKPNFKLLKFLINTNQKTI